MIYPTVPTWTQQQYATAFLRLLPQGACWPTWGSSQMAQSLYPLSGPYADNNELAAEPLVDAFPATTVQLAPEWLETLGLPGPCVTGYANSAATQQAILAQLTDTGGCSTDYFVGYANSIGFQVTIEQYIPLRVGMPVGSSVLDDSYAFIWTVQIISGSPASLLYCELARRNPAHLMLYVIDTDGTVTAPPPILYPTVSASITGGVATISIPTPFMQPASVDYSGGAFSGTVTFEPGIVSQTVAMSNAVSTVTLSNPYNLAIG